MLAALDAAAAGDVVLIVVLPEAIAVDAAAAADVVVLAVVLAVVLGVVCFRN